VARIKLAKRLRDLPTHRGFLAVLEDLQNSTQSDRGVAIIGASYVDLVLREAITAQLARKDEKLMSQLFEDRGPLSAFGDRISVGYALGIYASGVYQDLRAMKDIRNAFAHSAEAIDFAHENVGRLAENLILPKRVHYRGRPDPTTPRECYVTGVELVADGLLSDLIGRKGGREGETILKIPAPKG
jgi:hypothetical protein